MSEIKRTSLYEAHQKAGGKIVEFAGWEMPIQYEGLVVEHEAVRNKVGIFDVSHMGEVSVKGTDAEKFVNHLVSNDVSKLNPNQIAYAMMCYEHGGIVDDLLNYKYAEDHYFLVINASNVDKDFAWMQEQAKAFDVVLVNLSEDFSEIAVQGPNAQALLQKLTETDLNEIEFFYFKDGVKVCGYDCIVSRTGYTGEDGFEVYMTHDAAPVIWEALLEKGQDLGVKPTGLGCRDTLRFEAGLPLYGNELDHDISPLEAGLGMFVKLDKPFVGRDALVKQKEEGLKRKTAGFEMVDRGIPRHGYEVAVQGKVIGHVTTGYTSPTVGRTIGTALIDASYSEMGTELDVLIRNKPAKAKIVSKRFYTKKYKK
jgi:aminomethyltransferase